MGKNKELNCFRVLLEKPIKNAIQIATEPFCNLIIFLVKI